MNIYLSIDLSIYLSIYLFIYLSISIHIGPFCGHIDSYVNTGDIGGIHKLLHAPTRSVFRTILYLQTCRVRNNTERASEWNICCARPCR